MLKLKDIFNIDISSKGGGKLYKKIMRKYNIPLKEIKEVKQEIVECSSGGSGEGAKEYYYKWLTDDENIRGDIASLIGMICDINSILIPSYEGYGKINAYIDTNYVPLAEMMAHSICIGFSINADSFILAINSDSTPISVSPKGSLVDRMKKYGDEGLMYIEELNNAVQEITKEEYEAMITYKPE